MNLLFTVCARAREQDPAADDAAAVEKESLRAPLISSAQTRLIARSFCPPTAAA